MHAVSVECLLSLWSVCSVYGVFAVSRVLVETLCCWYKHAEYVMFAGYAYVKCIECAWTYFYTVFIGNTVYLYVLIFVIKGWLALSVS